MVKKKDSKKSTKGDDSKKASAKKSSTKKAKTSAKNSGKTMKTAKVKKGGSKSTKKKGSLNPTKESTGSGDALIHVFIPPHRKLSDNEKKEVQDRYKVSTREMPKININDPAISHMSVKEGDIIEITRNSLTAGEIKFYRSVIRD